MLSELRQYCAKTLEPHKIAFAMNANVPDDAQPPSMLMYMSLFKIVREAITNIIKHAKATEVSIDIKIDEETLRCSVADNGQAGKLKSGSGRGLLSMQSRAKELGGTLEVVYNNGMHIVLTAPLEHNGEC